MLAALDTGLLREARVILLVYLGVLLHAVNYGFSAVAMPDIKNEMRSNSSGSYIPSVQATDEQLSWFASSLNIGSILGCFLGGYFGGKYGPKRAIQCSCIIGSLGWLAIAVAPHVSFLIIGRVLCGVSGSFSTPNCSLLVSQYSSAKRRGVFLALFGLMFGIGILICYCLGAVLYWRYVASLPPLLYILLALGLFFPPESPIWLLGHKGENEARTALVWLRFDEEVGYELQALKELKEKKDHGLTMTDALKNLSKREIRTPFTLIMFNFLFGTFSGPNVIVFYAVEIFNDVGVSTSGYLAAIITAASRVLGGVLSLFLVRRMKRLKLAMLSMTILATSMIVLGAVYYYKQFGENTAVKVLPVIFAPIFMFAYGAGTSPLMWVFVGELLPPEYQVLAGLATGLTVISIFIVTKTFPILVQALGSHGTFWVFAAIAMSSNVFYYFFVPETKGKSLLEIKKNFK